VANNISVKDSSGATQVVKTTDTAGVHTPHRNVDNFPATQAISAAALPLPTGAATETTLGTRLTESDFDTKTGALTETAPGTDTASSGLNGRLQRLAQRLTSLIAQLPAALVGGRLDVNLGAAPATVTVGALPAGANNIGDVDVLTIAAGDNNIGNVDVVTLPALPAGSNNIGDVDVLTIAAGDNNIGNVDVVTLPALPAGSNNIGDVDLASAIPAGTALIGRVNPEPETTGGLTIGPGSGRSLLSAATTNATSVKASAGQVYAIYAHNLNAAVRYLKLYNKASAPTVGTDTPVLTLPIPGNTAGAGFVLDTGGMGIAFATGVALALTTGVADADTGAVAANEIVVTVLYK